ncbi:MAG: VacJ family lipoprotein [Rhodobacteraceae bacterium]|nr:VacJ family lipoprotein [Paracoccaceae bacterium]
MKGQVSGVAVAIAVATGLSGCAHAPEGAEFNDPYEAGNRKIHRFNVAIDSFFFGNPEKKGVLPIIPKPIATGFSNFSHNVGMPSAVVNNLLQFKIGPAVQDTFRFAINTTVGIGGLFDPASTLGIPAVEADFGQTLHRWGVGEGAYLEAPFLGPTTERDIAGTIIDIAIDPMNNLFPPREANYITLARLTAKVGNRQQFADTYESILYDSADSYAQARLLFLQNRHYELGIEEDVADPYEDPYAP